ncbi:hypothetical protein LINPERHAP2_LOCUS30091 [Linum perenne]
MFIQNSLNQLWHYDGSIQVLEVGFGLLQVVFPSVDAANWVLERRPWSINMSVMNMIPFSPPSAEIFNELQFMAVWIKLSRVPSHCITTRFGREFLPFFGEVLDVSLFGSRGRDAIFIKGLVKIDLLASFLGRRKACGPDNIPFWVRLHYESISCICFRCGYLGHSSSRCPHSHIPLDHEARGPWMNIGRVGFRIMENSLQKYIQNQNKAKKKKMESENLDFGQFSFVTKEKRFGYTVEPLKDESEMENNDEDVVSVAIPSKMPCAASANRSLHVAGSRRNIRRGPPASDGLNFRSKQAPLPQGSTPAVLHNKENKKKAESSKGPGGLYIPPGRRRMGGISTINNHSQVESAANLPNRRPSRAAVPPHLLSANRKLTYEDKGKGKMIEDSRSIPAKKWVPAKGIVIRETNAMNALPNPSDPDLPLKNRLTPSRLAGPSKVGNWIDPNRDIRVADESVDFPHRCFERKSYSLELIRNLYQQEDEDEKEEEALEQVNLIRSAPTVGQFNEVGSPISLVNQPTQEPSLNDIGWLRPVVGRWGDVLGDDDFYAEQSFGEEEEEIDIPMGEAGEDDAQDEREFDN